MRQFKDFELKEIFISESLPEVMSNIELHKKEMRMSMVNGVADDSNEPMIYFELNGQGVKGFGKLGQEVVFSEVEMKRCANVCWFRSGGWVGG